MTAVQIESSEILFRRSSDGVRSKNTESAPHGEVSACVHFTHSKELSEYSQSRLADQGS